MTSSAPGPIKVLVVDDNDFIRLGIKTALNTVNSIAVVGESSNGLEAVQKYTELAPDVVLMDLEMPRMNGVAATSAIKEINPASKVIILTSHDQEAEIYRALSAGASGYCLKDVDLPRLQDAIRAVHSGDLWLDSSIAGKVVKLCSGQTISSGRIDQRSTLAFGTLTDVEREIMNLLVNGCTTSDIAVRLNLPVSTAKVYVINVLNKVTAVNELRTASGAGGNGEAALNFSRDSTLMEKYDLIGQLGVGGMSVVFKARHRLLDRVVAVKLLNGEAFQYPRLQKRFLKEAQITSSLSHPNIITVYDFGINVDGQPYIVMDHIDGPTLAQLLERGGPIREREAIGLFSQVASALAFAHARGVVHRDIKPGNVILSCVSGEPVCAKVLDFGLAQTAEKLEEEQKLTQHGYALGSPLYMSPEQCQGMAVDARSDMYSFGCLMYEVLRGAPPFKGPSALDTMNLHVYERAPRLDQFVSSRQLRYLIERCLSKSPGDRFNSAQEITYELAAAVT